MAKPVNTLSPGRIYRIRAAATGPLPNERHIACQGVCFDALCGRDRCVTECAALARKQALAPANQAPARGKTFTEFVRQQNEAEAKKRMQVRKGDQPGATPAQIPELSRGDARAQAAQAFGVSALNPAAIYQARARTAALTSLAPNPPPQRAKSFAQLIRERYAAGQSSPGALIPTTRRGGSTR